MDNRKWEADAIASPPTAPVAPSSGYPTNGNPQAAQNATEPGAWWFHAVGEELRAVIEAGGLTPDIDDLTQLQSAIAAQIAANIAPDATETVKGKAEIATQAEVDAGTDDARFVTPLKLKNAKSHGLGYGQAWQDVTASRANGVTYTNSTGKPIQVLVSFADTNGLTAVYTVNVGGVNIINALQYDLSTSSGAATAAFVVPNGVAYAVSWTNAILSRWSELR